MVDGLHHQKFTLERGQESGTTLGTVQTAKQLKTGKRTGGDYLIFNNMHTFVKDRHKLK